VGRGRASTGSRPGREPDITPDLGPRAAWALAVPGSADGTASRRGALRVPRTLGRADATPRVPRDVSGVERSKRNARVVERCVASLRGGKSALIRGRQSGQVVGRSLQRPTNPSRRREGLHPGRRRRQGSIPSALVRRRVAVDADEPVVGDDAGQRGLRHRRRRRRSSRGASARWWAATTTVE